MKEFVALRAKTYSYLKDNNDEDEKANSTKKFIIKKKEAAHIENKTNQLEQYKVDVDSLKDQTEFTKTNKLMLKTQQRFGSEKHVFTE